MWRSNLPSLSLLGLCHKRLVRGQNFHSLLVESSHPLPTSFVTSMETTWRTPPSGNKVSLPRNYWVGCLRNPARESRFTSLLSINETVSLPVLSVKAILGARNPTLPSRNKEDFGCQEMPVRFSRPLTSPGSDEEANLFPTSDGKRGSYLR